MKNKYSRIKLMNLFVKSNIHYILHIRKCFKINLKIQYLFKVFYLFHDLSSTITFIEVKFLKICIYFSSKTEN